MILIIKNENTNNLWISNNVLMIKKDIDNYIAPLVTITTIAIIMVSSYYIMTMRINQSIHTYGHV